MDEDQIKPKVSGYLEKKGRKKMMSCYKKYWFVLEGRLLLYYKSKDEYDAISPCKGSINLGPTCNVKPCTSNNGVFLIESKTTTITLRAETREDQNKWMQAIMSALNHKNGSQKLSHFRYSLGELPSTTKKPLERQNTYPERFINSSPTSNIKIIERLQKIGAQSYGIRPKLQRSHTTLERQMSFSDESLSSTGNFKKDVIFRKTESVIIENEEFGMLNIRKYGNSVESVDASSDGIYERIPSNDSVFIRKEDEELSPRLIPNHEPDYCTVEREKSSDASDEDIIHRELREVSKPEKITNTGLTHKEAYWNRTTFKNHKSNEHVCEGIESKVKGQIHRTSETNRDANIFAESSNIAEYAKISPRNSSVSSQGSNEDKEKRKFKGFGRKNKNQKEKPEDKITKVRKSESFLQRVLSKKTKNKKKKDIYLSSEKALNKDHALGEDTTKMINALQDILESKKSTSKKLHVDEDAASSVKDQENSMIYQEVLADDNIGKNQLSDDIGCPTLPPRNQKQKETPCHDVPKTQPALPPKRKRILKSVFLDDILDDLNKQTQTEQEQSVEQDETKESQNGEGKVKSLIKRFSIGKEEGVELRKKNLKIRSQMYSNELDRLLDELAKVTTAPIMTPGVTTSLINPEVSDTEILKMVPMRRRRISDPDYDIPRPHRSLNNIPKKDNNALQATRFFGPILKPSDFEELTRNRPPTPAEDYHSNLPSMTPDSLEGDCQKFELTHDENRNISYHSHDYLSFNKRGHNPDFLADENVYDDPRFSYKTKNYYSEMYQDINFNRTEDSFIDSLEI